MFSKSNLRPAVIAVVIAMLAFSIADCQTDGQDQWSQFRGKHRDGKSDETNLLSKWLDGGPQLEWIAAGCGKGYSSVAIAEGRVFTIGDVDDQQIVSALDAKSGKLVWQRSIGAANQGPSGGSRSTPTFDGGNLYCLNTDAVLLCLDATKGEIQWKRDLASQANAQMMLAMDKVDWRFSESPLVDGNQVIVSPGSLEAAMIAFDKKTGDESWRTKVPELGESGRDGAAYSSAIISNACGVRQYVQLIGRGLISVDAKSGKFLWGYNRIANDVANISSPFAVDDMIFASTGYQTGAALLNVKEDKVGGLEAEEAYFLNSKTFQNHHGGFIVHEGHIYGGHGHKMGLPICIRLQDGKVMWGPIRNQGKSSAAVCYADGHLYFRYQNGLMVLIEATPVGYREKGSFMIPDVRAESWSHPAIANGRLYLKEQDRVLCYVISNDKQPELASNNQDKPEPVDVTAKQLAELAESWKEFVDKKAMDDEFSGAVMLAKGDKIIWQTAHGLASKRFQVPNNVETKFNLGSMNKMFTGVAICQLYEQGKLKFDDTIDMHLADYPNRDVAAKVTIHQLLTHTSGLGSYWNERFDQRYSKLRSLQDFLPLFVDDPLTFEPGSQSQYSNVGPLILGLIIEKISGQSYYDYVRKQIYLPAGMENTDCYELDLPVSNLAIGYTRMDFRGQATNQWRNNYFVHAVKGGPAGGGYSTVGDFQRFAMALQNNQLLKPETRDVMLKGRMELGPGVKYGYLFGDHVDNGLQRHGHTGGAPGISAEFFYYPKLDVSYAVLSNYDRAASPVSRFISRLIAAEFGQANESKLAEGAGKKYKLGVAFQFGGDEIRVAEVFENTPAEKAGIRVDDIILEVSGTVVDEKSLLATLDKLLGSGTPIDFLVRRNEKELRMTVKPIDNP